MNMAVTVRASWCEMPSWAALAEGAVAVKVVMAVGVAWRGMAWHGKWHAASDGNLDN